MTARNTGGAVGTLNSNILPGFAENRDGRQ